uniref:Transcription elongation factor SPT5 n=1 Tax=Rhabditophanes sp. KR3021 TaxID=114890 RepID=A0AC35UG06_9BILA
MPYSSGASDESSEGEDRKKHVSRRRVDIASDDSDVEMTARNKRKSKKKSSKTEEGPSKASSKRPITPDTEPSTSKQPIKKAKIEEDKAPDVMSDESEDEGDDLDEDEEINIKRKTKANPFINDDISESDNEEEVMSDDDLYNENAESRELEMHRKQTEKFETRKKSKYQDMNEDELNVYFTEKYKKGPVQRPEDFEDMDESGFTKQTNTVRSDQDPAIFIIKTRIGEAKTTGATLFKKFCSERNRGENTSICSIMVKENLNQYIYIEAFSKSVVTNFVKGVPGILMNNTFSKVPNEEIVETIAIRKEAVNLEPGAYVRFKKTLYKEDLAEVINTDTADGKVLLRYLPRIDYTKMRGNMKDSLTPAELAERQKKKFSRIPKGPLNLEKVQKIGGEVTQEGDFYLFEGIQYKKGFGYKWFSTDTVYSADVRPSADEIEIFKVADTDNKSDGFKRQRIELLYMKYQVGEKVEIQDGELTGVKGEIIEVKEKLIVIKPKNLGRYNTQSVEVPPEQISKYFDVSDHIKVDSGKEAGDTGIVVKYADNKVFYVSDLTKQELQILPNDCTLSNEISVGVDSQGKFSHLDFVLIDAGTVGVIVRIGRNSLDILTQSNVLVSKNPSQIATKLDNKRTPCFDMNKNKITAGDQVTILDGPFCQKKKYEEKVVAQIKFIYKRSIFVFASKHKENCGYFCVNQKDILLYGATLPQGNESDRTNLENIKTLKTGILSAIDSVTRPDSFKVPVLPGNNRGDPNGRGGMGQRGGQGGGRGGGQGGRGGGAFRPPGRNPLIGKAVTITGGPYKSYLGCVKDVTQDVARVELHTNCKTINVSVARLSANDGSTAFAGSGGRSTFSGNRNSQSNSSYNSNNSRNTSRNDDEGLVEEDENYGMGSKTPMQGSKTPMYGSQTPNPNFDDGYEQTIATPRHEYGGEDDYALDTYNINEDFQLGSVNPQTPGAFMSVATPYSGGVPMTPGMSFDAMTPASNLASGSKGQTAHFDNHMRSGCWAMVGMHVKVMSDTKNGRKGPKVERLGFISDFDVDCVKVQFEDDHSVETHNNENILPVPPKRNEPCRFVFGDHFKTKGTVKDIHIKNGEEKEYLVLSSNGDMLLCPETHLYFDVDCVKVQFEDDHSVETHNNENILPVPPKRNEPCRFVFGDHFKTKGTVKDIHIKNGEEKEYLVLSSNGDMLLCPETHLCKIRPVKDNN